MKLLHLPSHRDGEPERDRPGARAAPPMSSLQIKPHHSFDDWDFLGHNWPNYDTAIFLSPPTSLHSTARDGLNRRGHSVLKTYPNLPNIRFVNNYRFDVGASGFHTEYFRAQANPGIGATPPANCYCLEILAGMVTFVTRIGGIRTEIATRSFTPSLAPDTWHKYRMSAWDVPNSIAPTHLAYRFDLWQVDRYVTLLEGLVAPSRWFNSTVNRYGFYIHNVGHPSTAGERIDDTEIWVPAA